jgi:two-component system, LuxR family, sensor kinase FixL
MGQRAPRHETIRSHGAMDTRKIVLQSGQWPGMAGRWMARFTEGSAGDRGVLATAAVGLTAVAIVDWSVGPNLSLAYLYCFPILLLGLAAPPGVIVLVGVLCSFLREQFGPSAWEAEWGTRLIMGSLAFAGTGLFVWGQARSRRALAAEVRRRELAEEDLRMLVESSPAAILIATARGDIALANGAAARVLTGDDGQLAGENLAQFLPAVASVLDRTELTYRTALECVGRRRDGDAFLAHIWFSTYRTQAGTRLAAIILDTSEDLRAREATRLDGVLNASRIMVAAVSHEVKNLSLAANVARSNLARHAALQDDPDLLALRTCIEGLQRIASSELRLSADPVVGRVDLAAVLDELRVVLEPQFREAGAELRWSIAPGVGAVLGERHSIVQIFLNLAQNSLKAMRSCADMVLSISVANEGPCAVVRFRDTGPGIPDPGRIFRPFESGGGGAGLGLFVSRTLARYFAGDLRVEPSAQGSHFVLSLTRPREAS